MCVCVCVCVCVRVCVCVCVFFNYVTLFVTTYPVPTWGNLPSDNSGATVL